MLVLFASVMGFNSVANARTLVVQIASFDPLVANHGLLFALHSLKDSRGTFGNPAYDLTVKVVFSGDGVLNASNKIKHSKVTFETRPEDPAKKADVLIKALVDRGVQIKATGFGLKQFGLDPKTDLLPGVSGGGSTVIPRFIMSAEDKEGVAVVNF